MNGKSNPTFIWRALCIATAVLLVFGVIRMFKLRFRAGDIHRPYSSLRADPLGTKVFHDSLAELKAITVDRNYQRLDRLETDGNDTIMLLGVRHFPGFGIGDEMVEACERAARSGARVVVSFYPRNRNDRGEQSNVMLQAQRRRRARMAEKKRESQNDEEEEQGSDEERPEGAGGMETNGLQMGCFVDVNKRWNVAVTDESVEEGAFAAISPACRIVGLPDALSCHTSMYFDKLGSEWREIYARDDKAVVIERAMGRGSIVLSALSYVFSNEAMRDERQSGLLAWFVGDGIRVVFDEYHHGISSRPGMGSLLRDYSLHWVVAVALVLGALFVWRNALSLVPPAIDPAGTPHAPDPGRDCASGLANLLRRNVPQREILAACLNEWVKSKERLVPGRTPELDRIRELVVRERETVAEEKDCVRTYNAVVELLKRRYVVGTVPSGAPGKNGAGKE